jgi:hypothetical protein
MSDVVECDGFDRSDATVMRWNATEASMIGLLVRNRV